MPNIASQNSTNHSNPQGFREILWAIAQQIFNKIFYGGEQQSNGRMPEPPRMTLHESAPQEPAILGLTVAEHRELAKKQEGAAKKIAEEERRKALLEQDHLAKEGHQCEQNTAVIEQKQEEAPRRALCEKGIDIVPGLLLRPPPTYTLGKENQWSLQSWAHSMPNEFQTVEHGAGYVHVDSNAVVIFNEKKIPIIRKQIRLMPGKDYLDLRKEQVILNTRSNVHDDIKIHLDFTSEDAAAVFAGVLQKMRSGIEDALVTKIYVCRKDSIARPLEEEHPFHDLVTQILTGMWKGTFAWVLTPIFRLDVSPVDPSSLFSEVTQYFSEHIPPIIFINDSEDPDTFQIDEHQYDDLENVIEPWVFELPIPLPDRPLVDMKQILKNNGFHDRKTNAQKISLSISPVLAKWLQQSHAWVRAMNPSDWQYHQSVSSRNAIHANIIVTLVHELAHICITIREPILGSKDSPPRAKVKGADAQKFDICLADGSSDEGHVEAGFLAEVAWLGGRADLAIDHDGWFRLSLRNPAWNAPSPSSTNDLVDQSPPCPINFSDIHLSFLQTQEEAPSPTSIYTGSDGEGPDAEYSSVEVVLVDDATLRQFYDEAIFKFDGADLPPNPSLERRRLRVEKSSYITCKTLDAKVKVTSQTHPTTPPRKSRLSFSTPIHPTMHSRLPAYLTVNGPPEWGRIINPIKWSPCVRRPLGSNKQQSTL